MLNAPRDVLEDASAEAVITLAVGSERRSGVEPAHAQNSPSAAAKTPFQSGSPVLALRLPGSPCRLSPSGRPSFRRHAMTGGLGDNRRIDLCVCGT
jgi:hypothetical protein